MTHILLLVKKNTFLPPIPENINLIRVIDLIALHKQDQLLYQFFKLFNR